MCRQFVKVMILGLITLLHWLMEKPCGACLIITFVWNIIVLVLLRSIPFSWSSLFSTLGHFSITAASFLFIMRPQDLNETNGETSIMSATDYTDAVHNFILSQKLPSLLGNFPEVQILHILYIQNNGRNCSKSCIHIMYIVISYRIYQHRYECMHVLEI